jgi:hypothetical protein
LRRLLHRHFDKFLNTRHAFGKTGRREVRESFA